MCIKMSVTLNPKISDIVHHGVPDNSCFPQICFKHRKHWEDACFQKVLFVIIFSELDYNSKKYFFKLLIETLEYSGLYLCVCVNIYIQS